MPDVKNERVCEDCGGPGVSWEDGVILCDDCAILRMKRWQMWKEQALRHCIRADRAERKLEMEFEFFEDVDSMYQRMKERETEANLHVHPVQKNITYGSYWLRPVDFDESIVQVFGHVVPLEDLEREEDEGTLAALRESYERGYRFCRCYSTIVPDGEYGDTHISVMIPITEVMFEAAKDAGWVLSPDLLHSALEYSNMFIIEE